MQPILKPKRRPVNTVTIDASKRDLAQIKHLLVLWAHNKMYPFVPGLGYSASSIYERAGRVWKFDLSAIDYNQEHYGRVDAVLHNEMDLHLREVIEAEYGAHKLVKGGTQKKKAEGLVISLRTYQNRLSMAHEVLIIELRQWWK